MIRRYLEIVTNRITVFWGHINHFLQIYQISRPYYIIHIALTQNLSSSLNKNIIDRISSFMMIKKEFYEKSAS